VNIWSGALPSSASRDTVPAWLQKPRLERIDASSTSLLVCSQPGRCRRVERTGWTGDGRRNGAG
jgi:hypothetical protein